MDNLRALDESLEYLNEQAATLANANDIMNEGLMDKFTGGKKLNLKINQKLFGSNHKNFKASRSSSLKTMSAQEFSNYIYDEMDNYLESVGVLDYFNIGLYDHSLVDQARSMYRNIYTIYPRNKADMYDEKGNRISTSSDKKYIENFKKFTGGFNKLSNKLTNAKTFPSVVTCSTIHDNSMDADFILVYYTTDRAMLLL